MNNIKIIIIDEDGSYRKQLAEFLRKNGFAITGSFHNETFIEPFLLQIPEIAILAYKHKEIPGATLNAVSWLKTKYPAVKVVINTLVNDRISVKKFRKSGIEGLLIKRRLFTDEILTVLEKVHKGGMCYSKRQYD